MKLRFTLRATQDIASIAGHIHKENPRAALRVRAAILDSLQRLTAFPNIGRRQSVEGVRKVIARKYPYLIYYTLDADNDEIVLLTIQHPARQRQFSDD